MRERREVCVWIADYELLEMFVNRPVACRQYLRFPDLPPDAAAVAVTWDFMRRAYGVLFAHHSFNPVPDGMEAPSLMLDNRFEMVEMEPFLTRLENDDPVALAELQRLYDRYLSGCSSSSEALASDQPSA